MKCFYHSSDLDGHCSGAIVKFKYPECDMIGVDYRDEFPWESIQGTDEWFWKEEVFMVDFSLQPFKNMIKLFKICDLTWIDHHKSAIEEYNKINLNEGLYINGARSLDYQTAGCQLTWEYLMESEVPRAVKLLSEYDVWNHSDADTLPFQFGLRQYDTNPETQDLWLQLFEIGGINPLDKIIKEGSIILNYQASENKKYAEGCAFDTELDGLQCITINKMFTNSQIFDSVWDPQKYDAMLTFGFTKGQWTISLYSDKENIDVSEIAKSRGGGGHKGAAGFQCKNLPFKI